MASARASVKECSGGRPLSSPLGSEAADVERQDWERAKKAWEKQAWIMLSQRNTISVLQREADELEGQVEKLADDRRTLERQVACYHDLTTGLKARAAKLERRLQTVEAHNAYLIRHDRERQEDVRKLVAELLATRYELYGEGEDGGGGGDDDDDDDDDDAADADADQAGFHCRRIVFHSSPWQAEIEVKEADDGQYLWRPLASPSDQQRPFEPLDDPDPYRCSICRELFAEGEATLELPCRHRYHDACSEPFCKKYLRCPLCRNGFAVEAELLPIRLDGVEETGRR